MPSDTTRSPATDAGWPPAALAMVAAATTLVSLGLMIGGLTETALAIPLAQYLCITVLLYSLALGMRPVPATVAWPWLALAAIVVTAFVAGILSDGVYRGSALRRLQIVVSYIALAPAVAWLAARRDGTRHAFVLALIAGPLLHIPLVLAAALFEDRLGYGPLLVINIPYFHVRLWGVVLAAALAATLGLMACRPPSRQAVGFAVTAVLSAALFWSGSRVGLLGLVAAILLLPLLTGRKGLGALPAFAAGLLLGILLSLPVPIPDPNLGFVENFMPAAEMPAAEMAALSPDAVLSGRLTLWVMTWEQILKAPLVGNGFEQFAFFHENARAPDIPIFWHPHNAVLQFLFDFGFVGGTALIVLLLALWIRALRLTLRHPEPARIAAHLALTALAAMSLVEGVLYYEATLLVVALCFGLTLGRPAAPGARA
ncbi:O-antigen ligase family protein [Halovulum dunhuangense]|uniref:O-antigen ligase family protein n=1 Tax=Halovulum dunhuangense TaxID=1505036 RepID=A0A849L5C7_9RHOB|nr:O-antigen ligase family protein [Halovulum dunhuangense]NNU81341.1 O-antigen ligase family protein [Halovulum dunhuangense]